MKTSLLGIACMAALATLYHQLKTRAQGSSSAYQSGDKVAGGLR